MYLISTISSGVSSFIDSPKALDNSSTLLLLFAGLPDFVINLSYYMIVASCSYILTSRYGNLLNVKFQLISYSSI